MILNDIVIIIPSLNPDEKLNRVVDGMIGCGFSRIVLVDDGSDQDHKAPFEKAMMHPEVAMLVHEVNEGKGQALKTAFNYVYEEMKYVKAVITIDGDGQHTPEDAMKLAEGLSKEPDKVMMGCRDFSQSNVPTHNMLGNRITSWVFSAFCGIKLSDTQTGLRGIPYKYLKEFTGKIKGQRFEYETNMLLYMHDHDIEFTEIPIQTLYIEENKSSHFHVIKDSYRIYKLILFKSQLFRQVLTAAVCKVVDALLFGVFDGMLIALKNALRVFLATCGARIVSIPLNYVLNKKFVFHSKGNVKTSASRYLILALVQLLLSWAGVNILIGVFNAEHELLRTMIKLVWDAFLFFISYAVQKNWVFKKAE